MARKPWATRRLYGPEWDQKREAVWQRDKGVCQSPLNNSVCKGKNGELTLKTCHIDHITPLIKRGRNDLSNLRVLCRPCHVLRKDTAHRGMIAKALRDGIIPADWRCLVW